ncbi:hypothetical protein BDV93DRAFT_113616 [Ceratobasidium sp. AG-I]|nr:hypothetical protein BDV93DRAFT_113616 [Ceratobasidium sp. AG-I]
MTHSAQNVTRWWRKKQRATADPQNQLPSGQGQKTTTNRRSQVYVQERKQQQQITNRPTRRQTKNKPKSRQRSDKWRVDRPCADWEVWSIWMECTTGGNREPDMCIDNTNAPKQGSAAQKILSATRSSSPVWLWSLLGRACEGAMGSLNKLEAKRA